MSSTLSFVGHEPFFDVPRTSVSTSLGPVQLPILYRRTRNVNAFFLVDVDKVQAVLQPRVGDALQAACRLPYRVSATLATALASLLSGTMRGSYLPSGNEGNGKVSKIVVLV